MRKGKKILCVLLTCIMVFAMSITASASDYVITVENSVTGASYYAYKVLDATYDTDGNVAYTIDSSSKWYNLVSDTTTVYTDGTSDGSDGGASVNNPFTVTETTVAKMYNVTLANGKDGSDVANWFQYAAAYLNNAGITNEDAAASNTGNGGALELDVGAAGYYYVTTTTGSVVSLTSADPTAEIVDKNQAAGGLDKQVDDKEVQIGDTATYTITADIPAYDGNTEIVEYKFVDTLPDGLNAPNESEITVEILDDSGKVYAYLTSSTQTSIASVDTYAVSVSGQTITIDFNPTEVTKADSAETGDDLSALTSYPSDATILITYKAVVNSNAAYSNTNTVKMTWTGETTGLTSTQTVYTYGFNLQKVASTATTETIYGAEFTLKNGSNEPVGFIGYTSTGDKIYYNTDGWYYDDSKNSNKKTAATGESFYKYIVSADTSDDGYTTTIYIGSALIWGLDSDKTYTLTETKAPDGYNLLTAGINVTVGQTSQYSTGTGINTTTTVVENTSGSPMPETGGIGATIFYIVGAALIIGALIVLITRSRVRDAE